MIIRNLPRAVRATPRLCPSPASSTTARPLLSLHRGVTTTTSTSLDPDATIRPLSSPASNPHAASPSATSIAPPPSVQTTPTPSPFIQLVRSSPTPPPPPPSSGPLSTTVLSLLPSLAIQKPHYATLHLHARPYLVTEGDRIRLPFRMPGVAPGDVLRLTRASVLGSRDYTLRGAPWVDARLFEARAVVMGVESEPMRVMEKTKRRCRKVRLVRSKHRYTEVVVQEVRVKTLEEVMGVEEVEGRKVEEEGVEVV